VRNLRPRFESLQARLVPGIRESTPELWLSDNHPADSGSETGERARDVGLHRLVRQQLFEVDLARHRLEPGSNGQCESCGGPIPDARLAAIPEARRCIFCQSSGSPPFRHRPAEEEAMESSGRDPGVDPGAAGCFR